MDNSENRNSQNTQIEIKNKNIRVFVADDHQPMLETVVKLLTPHYDIVGTAADGKRALEMIRLLRPEVAVLDISMPFKTGIEIAADLKTSGSQVKIVIITANVDEFYVRAAIDAGASGFVLKTRLGSQLLPAIESAFAEKVITSLDDKLTGDLMESGS